MRRIRRTDAATSCAVTPAGLLTLMNPINSLDFAAGNLRNKCRDVRAAFQRIVQAKLNVRRETQSQSAPELAADAPGVFVERFHGALLGGLIAEHGHVDTRGAAVRRAID